MLSLGRMPPREPALLFEDEHLLVLDKPSGLVMQRGRATDRITLMSWVRKHCRSAEPAHRLDRATSGVLLLCKDSRWMPELQAQFGDGRVVKNYLALTRGICPELGLIDHGLRKSKLH